MANFSDFVNKKLKTNSKLGSNWTDFEGKADESPVLSTGSLIVDRVIRPVNGGVPRGGFTEIFGPESSGKTTLATSIMVQAQKKGGVAAFIDFEQTFHTVYATDQGLDLSTSKFFYHAPQTLEEGAKIIEELIKSNLVDVIVCDSVSAMIPEALLSGEIDAVDQPGLHARGVGKFIKKILDPLKKSNTALILLNQLRSVIKKNQYTPGPDIDTTGGKALKFYASCRLELKKKDSDNLIVERESEVTGEKKKTSVASTVVVRCIKNKINNPWNEGKFHIRFKEGVDNTYTFIELGVLSGAIGRKGNSYLFQDPEEKSKPSLEQARKFLKENPEFLKPIKERVFEYLTELDARSAERHVYAEKQPKPVKKAAKKVVKKATKK